MKRIFILCAVILAIVYFAELGLAAMSVPGRTKFWVNDYAGVIDKDTKDYLEKRISSIKQKTPDPIEIIIATFKSLDGWQLKDFALAYGENWRAIKKEKRDNGIAILLILDTKRVTIGVGQNLKDILTNDIVGNIANNTIFPEIKKDDYSGGIKKAVEEIITILDKAEIPRDSSLFTLKNIIILSILAALAFVIAKVLRSARK